MPWWSVLPPSEVAFARVEDEREWSSRVSKAFAARMEQIGKITTPFLVAGIFFSILSLALREMNIKGPATFWTCVVIGNGAIAQSAVHFAKGKHFRWLIYSHVGLLCVAATINQWNFWQVKRHLAERATLPVYHELIDNNSAGVRW